MKAFLQGLSRLSQIGLWVMHAQGIIMHICNAATDVLCFVRTFGAIILHSTLHLYLSTLPFAPTQTRIFRQFTAKFPRTPRVFSASVIHWPLKNISPHVQLGHVLSLTISPDRNRIVSSSVDGMIRLWDLKTGRALCAPLRGHTVRVMCLRFSPLENGLRLTG
ncbi:hypothetical protein BDR05DRAFT_1026736 [Suillus weaverae]|nr:hypothetical protein BDR05DRAFT_1026736 [Suillus weaverae]